MKKWIGDAFAAAALLAALWTTGRPLWWNAPAEQDLAVLARGLPLDARATVKQVLSPMLASGPGDSLTRLVSASLATKVGADPRVWALLPAVLSALAAVALYAALRLSRLGPCASLFGAVLFSFQPAAWTVAYHAAHLGQALCAAACALGLLFSAARFGGSTFLAFWIALKTGPAAAPAALLAATSAWRSGGRRLESVALAAASLLLGAQWLAAGWRWSAADAYPLAAAAVPAVAWLADRRGRSVTVFALAAWIFWTYPQWRHYRNAELTSAAPRRVYLDTLNDALHVRPPAATVYFNLPPEGLHGDALWHALTLATPPGTRIDNFAYIDDSGSSVAPPPRDALLWDAAAGRLHVLRDPTGTPPPSELEMRRAAPWQLGPGWSGVDNGIRNMHPRAALRLSRPAGASGFTVRIHLGDPPDRTACLDLSIDGAPPRRLTFTGSGSITSTLPLAPTPAKEVELLFLIPPECRLPGGSPDLPIAWLGFR